MTFSLPSPLSLLRLPNEDWCAKFLSTPSFETSSKENSLAKSFNEGPRIDDRASIFDERGWFALIRPHVQTQQQPIPAAVSPTT